MRLKTALVLGTIALAAVPVGIGLLLEAAHAAEEPKSDAKSDAKSDTKGGKPGTNVDMPFLMAPMNGADGKLSGYAYISTRLTASSDAFALKVRDRIAFIQDAFVRDVNEIDVAKKDDATQVDQPALEARLLADAKKVMGAGEVVSINIVQLQIAPLHPTETPNLYAPPTPLPPAADSKAKPAESKKSGA
jgi:hypothetical protein